MQLQQKLAERTKLLSQLEQAKMQEKVSETMQSMNSITSSGPNLDQVRDKIERRYANALGQAELAQNSVEGRMLEVEKATLDVAGASRLDVIRASMGGGTPAVESVAPAAALEQGALLRGPPGGGDGDRAPEEREIGAGGGHEGAEVVFEVFVVNGHGGWCFPLKIFWL